MTDFRALCAELVNQSPNARRMDGIASWEALIKRARTALAQPEQAGELPPGYIDSGHSDLNRELLEAFYLAAQSEGGTADEIHLRGIQAAIALDRSRRAPVQAAAAPEHELLTQFNDATSSIERELRQARAVMEEVLIARRAPVQPAAGEVGELVEWLKGSAEDERWLCGGNNHRSEKLDRAAALLQRLQPVQPVAVSERLPRAEDCLDEGWAWFFSPRVGWRQAVLPVSPAFTHWLPAHVLPLPTTPPEAP